MNARLNLSTILNGKMYKVDAVLTIAVIYCAPLMNRFMGSPSYGYKVSERERLDIERGR